MSEAVKLRETSLDKEIKRQVALAHINYDIIDTDALAILIHAKYPHADLGELTDQIAEEVISRRGGVFLSRSKKEA